MKKECTESHLYKSMLLIAYSEEGRKKGDNQDGSEGAGQQEGQVGQESDQQ